jgi:hypothetical protein
MPSAEPGADASGPQPRHEKSDCMWIAPMVSSVWLIAQLDSGKDVWPLQSHYRFVVNPIDHN